jgi:hypothetical protein
MKVRGSIGFRQLVAPSCGGEYSSSVLYTLSCRCIFETNHENTSLAGSCAVCILVAHRLLVSFANVSIQ